MQPLVLPSSEQNLGEMCVGLLSGGSGTGYIFWLRPYKTSPGYCGTCFSDSVCVCVWCVHGVCMCVSVYIWCVHVCVCGVCVNESPCVPVCVLVQEPVDSPEEDAGYPAPSLSAVNP